MRLYNILASVILSVALPAVADAGPPANQADQESPTWCIGATNDGTNDAETTITVIAKDAAGKELFKVPVTIKAKSSAADTIKAIKAALAAHRDFKSNYKAIRSYGSIQKKLKVDGKNGNSTPIAGIAITGSVAGQSITASECDR